MEPRINVCDPKKCDKLKCANHEHDMSDTDFDNEVYALYKEDMKNSPMSILDNDSNICRTSGTTRVSFICAISGPKIFPRLSIGCIVSLLLLCGFPSLF